MIPPFTLYVSDLPCGHDTWVAGRFRNELLAMDEAKIVQGMTLRESGQAIFICVMRELPEEPYQEPVYVAVRDVMEGVPGWEGDISDELTWRVENVKVGDG